jgi:hypothetical protein
VIARYDLPDPAMIAFACRCKCRFELPDDQAGGVIQCTTCGRLNDVPTLDDLPHLDADGVFNVYVDRPADDPARLAELGILYAKGTRDAEGDEIDLRRGAVARRLPDDDDDNVIPLADEPPEERPRPKYDPETGELIRPIELREDPDHPKPGQAIPLAQAVIGYAMPGTDFRRISPARVLIELFAPANAMVMAFVVLTCLLLVISSMIVNFGFIFIAIAPIVLGGALIAHFGITVEEIGPLEQDELPRLLRGLSWHEDLWGPFKKVVGSFVLAFWPVALVARAPQALAFILVWAAIAGGLFFLPALLLTWLTSGTWLNLRPDRVLGVIRAAGGHYVVAVVGGVISIVASCLGMILTSLSTWNAFANTSHGGFLARWFVAFPLLLIAVYAAHAWAWYLGLMYRAHHAQFPWILQRHISTRRTSLDPATDYHGRAQRPRRSTGEKLHAIRGADQNRRA